MTTATKDSPSAPRGRGAKMPKTSTSKRPKDDFGRIARMLDGWADTIIEADQLRTDLERTRERLDQAIIDADTALDQAFDAEQRAQRAEQAAQAVPEPMIALPAPEPEPELAPIHEPRPEAAPRPRTRPSVFEAFGMKEGDPKVGPISSVSQQLQNFTQYVTAAANDVERTEALIKGIDQMT